MKALRSVALAFIGFSLLAPAAKATTVFTELLLLVDVSGSIDATEFSLQRTGYANAFADAAVQSLIAANPGGVAVSLVYWSGTGQFQTAVNWTQLTNAASANAFSSAIAAAARPFNGSTAVQNAINLGYPLFNNNGFEGTNLIIDVSGDGADNDSAAGLLPHVGRDNALANGVTTINGLVILGEAGLSAYYTNNVIGGAGATLYTASSFADFDNAVKNKIAYEVSGVPEPSTWVLMSSGLVGFALLRRRKSRR